MFQRSIYCEAQKEMFAILLDIWYDGFLLNMQTVFKNHIINVNNGHMQVHLVYINTFFLFPNMQHVQTHYHLNAMFIYNIIGYVHFLRNYTKH